MSRPRKTGLECVLISVNSCTHWKVKRLAKLCALSHNEAYGCWVKLMCYVGQHHADNDLTMLTDDDINEAAGYVENGQATMNYAQALQSSDVNVLTRTRRGKLRVNGWDEYNGRYWRQLQRDRARKRVPYSGVENPRKTTGKSSPPYHDRTGPYPKSSAGKPPKQTFATLLKAVERREVTTARKGKVLYRVFLSNDKNGVVLDAGDGVSDQVRLFSPKQIEGYVFGKESPGRAGGLS